MGISVSDCLLTSFLGEGDVSYLKVMISPL